ncbi:MAG: suppressor of fused domain protein, partial [Lachnospiraceae bacterium]|nr:suppressor of fused domain protein [Lachnospiraceae bacterium]
MSIFDKLKKKEVKQEKPEEIKTYGWDAITEICEKAYPSQKNPLHYGTLIKWRFVGIAPLEGISIY